MGARDSSFMNKVSYLAKWLIQSITTFIISKFMHSFSIQRFMQKSVLNASRPLTISRISTLMEWDFSHRQAFGKLNQVWWFKIQTASLSYIYFNSKNTLSFFNIRQVNVIFNCYGLWYKEKNKSIFMLYFCWQTIYEPHKTLFFSFWLVTLSHD